MMNEGRELLVFTRQGPGSPGVLGMSGGVGSKGSEAGSAVYCCIIMDKSLIFTHACMHQSVTHSLNKCLQRTRLCAVFWGY